MMRFRNRGVGALIPPSYAAGSVPYAQYCDGLTFPDSFNPLNIGYCLANDIGTKAISQAPGQDVFAGTSSTPTIATCSASDPGAILSGQDASGNPVYWCESTAQQNQTATVLAATAAAAASDAAAILGGSVDCSQWYNFLNSACTAGSGTNWLLIGAIAFGGLFFIEALMTGGRR